MVTYTIRALQFYYRINCMLKKIDKISKRNSHKQTKKQTTTNHWTGLGTTEGPNEHLKNDWFIKCFWPPSRWSFGFDSVTVGRRFWSSSKRNGTGSFSLFCWMWGSFYSSSPDPVCGKTCPSICNPCVFSLQTWPITSRTGRTGRRAGTLSELCTHTQCLHTHQQ